MDPVGSGGKRRVLMDSPAGPPLHDRYRDAEFYFNNGNLTLYSSVSWNPRLLVYATAKLDEPVQNALGKLGKATTGKVTP
jgi:hypothetical protein